LGGKETLGDGKNEQGRGDKGRAVTNRIFRGKKKEVVGVPDPRWPSKKFGVPFAAGRLGAEKKIGEREPVRGWTYARVPVKKKRKARYRFSPKGGEGGCSAGNRNGKGGTKASAKDPI